MRSSALVGASRLPPGSRTLDFRRVRPHSRRRCRGLARDRHRRERRDDPDEVPEADELPLDDAGPELKLDGGRPDMAGVLACTVAFSSTATAATPATCCLNSMASSWAARQMIALWSSNSAFSADVTLCMSVRQVLSLFVGAVGAALEGDVAAQAAIVGAAG